MEGFNWLFNFDPEFPMHIFPFTVTGNRDGIHWHRYYEIGLCTKGRGEFVYLNKVYKVKEGDLFVSNNFESHVAVSKEGEETEYIFLIFLPEFIADSRNRRFDLTYLSFLKYNPFCFVNRIDADLPEAKRLYELFTHTLEVYESDKGDAFRLMELDILVRRILLELSRHYANSSGGDGGDAEGDGFMHIKIQKAVKYINIHYRENITTQAMADMLELNPSYFRHLFKRSMHVPFKSYITFLRLSQAQKMLLAGNKSIGEIIYEAGCNNAHQFYTVFRKATGMTPAEFRRQYRSDES